MTAPDRPGRAAVPRVLLLTDSRAVPSGRSLVATVTAALGAGVDGVVLRERHLAPADRLALAGQVALAATASGSPASLLWAAPVPSRGRSARRGPGQASSPMTGVHLRAADPRVDGERPALVGRSCHSVEELRRAADEGCDYVTLSPVAVTGSKPGYGPALGTGGLHALLAEAAYLGPGAPRVLALGGVRPGSARQWLEAGAYGVAVMGAVMAADDPAAAAAQLVAEVTG